jgi:hypothetical protein
VLKDWPPYSPDLNPIEHIWWALKHAVYEVCPDIDEIKGKEDIKNALREALLKAWDLIPTSRIRACLESMPERIQAVIEAHGWHTKY